MNAPDAPAKPVEPHAGNWCVHYRYNRDAMRGSPNTCHAGVDLNQFHGMPHDKRPCFLVDGQSKSDAVSCDQIRRPTAEEMAVDEVETAQHMERIAAVMAGIRPWRNANKGKSKAEVVECPACKGRLHLSISGYNGHVHGACETVGCVSWME